jgi:4-amino-4-deoxy-L-arabinose transferase-like glycosyltransferase
LSEVSQPASDRTAIIAVMATFALVNLGLLAVNGVRLGGDTPLYIDGATRLLDGLPLVNRQPSYPGFVAVVALAQATGAGLVGVVLIQIAAASVAAATVYDMAAAFAGRAAGIAAAVLVAIDLETNRWHQFILADSLYASLFTIGVWLTHRAATRAGTWRIATAAMVLVAAGLVRPEGWFLIPAAVLYFVLMRARSKGQRLAGAAALIAAAALLIAILAPAVKGNVQAVGPGDMLRRGQTIWDFEGWRLAMPEGDAAGTGQASSAISYAMQHPASTITLMIARVAVHAAHVRPFYSTAHNAVILAWLLPIYALGAFALWRLVPDALALWIVAALATQTLVVALTHADWDGRYLAHVLPAWYAVAGAGIGMASGQLMERRRG